MKKYLLIITIIIWLFYFTKLYATDTNTNLIKTYNNFSAKLEQQYSYKDQINILEKIKQKIEQILKTKKISKKSIIILKELNKINNIKIDSIKKEINDNNFIDTNQIEIEKQEINKFKVLTEQILPNYILSILDNKTFLNVISDKNNNFFEFYDNNKIKRLIFQNYIIVNENTYSKLKNFTWYIFLKNWQYWFINEYEIEEKIPYSKSYNYFKWFINLESANYHLKNWIYYYYKFNQFNNIKDKYWFYYKSLISLNLEPKDNILLKNWNDYVFISTYNEEKLINSSIIKNITNKNHFLNTIYDDKKNINYDTDKYFEELKVLTENLTKWLSREDKINKIYNYILDNITYTNPIDLNKKEIFSWIHTYKNKDWVCEWYAKLMLYMLMFAWIEDVEVIRWFVINAPDFPNIWHAWLKIWDYYYDPTFDDPIWNTKTKKYDEYIYYRLPWDLFYTNRYDFTNLPEELKTKSKYELSNIVNKNLYDLVEKYTKSWYNLIKYSLILKENWLNYNDKITINTLKKLIWYYEVNWIEMSYIKNWEKAYIKKMKFYNLTDDSIEDLLKTINYNLTDKYIFKWNFWDWKYEYRLAYELENQ